MSFFFNDTSPTQIYTLSLHDALPISGRGTGPSLNESHFVLLDTFICRGALHQDRKSTRLNSSHRCISYAVFCLKKKSTINELVRAKKTVYVSLQEVHIEHEDAGYATV